MLRLSLTIRRVHTSRILQNKSIKWPVEKTRNVGIIAHIDAGKTTTTERMLFFSGHTRKIGDVDKGDTVMDFLEQEQERGITIQSAAITFGWRGHKINLIDTPGHADFGVEVGRSLRVLDGAVVILDGVRGTEAQTVKVCSQAAHFRIPLLVFVNKMDREGADFGGSLLSLLERGVCRSVSQHALPVPIQLPVFRPSRLDNGFHSIIDLVWMEHLKWNNLDGNQIIAEKLDDSVELSADERNLAAKARTLLVETLCEFDDDLLMDYSTVEDALKVSPESLQLALARCTAARKCVPVLCGSSFKNIGVQPLLDSIMHFLPSPDKRPPAIADVAGKAMEFRVGDRVMTALAFKVVNDRNKGPLAFVRVYSGELLDKSTLLNGRSCQKERILQLYQIYANEYEPISSIEAGNIGVVAGLKSVETGDTLLNPSDFPAKNACLPQLSKIPLPQPVFVRSLEPNSVSEEKLLMSALEKLQREDPSFHVRTVPDTSQTLISGMGELHLEIILDRLKREYKVQCKVGPVWTSYRETLKQSNTVYLATVNSSEISPQEGERNFSISLEISPLIAYADENVMTENQISVKEVVDSPRQKQQGSESSAIQFVKEGIEAALSKGYLVNFPIVGVRVDATVHNLDTGIPRSTLELASVKAVDKALQSDLRASSLYNSQDWYGNSKLTLLEPICNVKVSVPDSYLSSVLSDLNSNRRATITRLSSTESTQYDGYSDKQSDMSQYKNQIMDLFKISDRSQKDDQRQSTIDCVSAVSSMVGYSSTLRALTKGNGQFTMELSGYGPLSNERIVEIVREYRGGL